MTLLLELTCYSFIAFMFWDNALIIRLLLELDHVNYSRWMLVIVNAMKNNMLILVTVSYLIQNTLIYVFHVFPC